MFRMSNDLIHGIHFQASTWGSKDEGRFTINLVVTSRAIFEIWTGKSLPSNPACALLPIRRRIGELMPQNGDLWWDVDNSTDIGALADEVTKTIVSFALPYFSEYPDSVTLLSQLRQGVQIPGIPATWCTLLRAITAKVVGLPDEATDQILKALDDAESPSSRATVERIGQRIGVLP